METWLIIISSLCIPAILKALFNLLFPSRKPTHNLPPSPFIWPIIGNLLWLRKSFADLEPILRDLHSKFGPIVHITSRPAIFISDRFLIHQALIQNGAVFADRPRGLITRRIVSSNLHTINTAVYGHTWRLLRRNLTVEILNHSRVKSYSHVRKLVLQILKEKLSLKSGEAVLVVNYLRYAMFCLLVHMCFGDKLDESQIKKIEDAHRCLLLNLEAFNILNFWPKVTKILFYKKWKYILQIRKTQEDLFIPLIRAKKKVKQENLSKVKEDKEIKDGEAHIVSYVDTVLDLQLHEEKRKLDEGEIVSLCSEFLNGGTDTTSTALHWIMANLVKYPYIQEKLFMEIKGVVDGKDEVNEDDLQKMPYLKAVILQGLRWLPPAHFVLPHRVTEDVVFNNFLVPREGTVNFFIAEMGWDLKVWEDPMAFKPERFLNSDGGEEVFDITGSKEIKMIPFGAGRRMYPAYGLAMLHLEYFVANLVLSFEWKAVDGDDIDLSEKQEFTMVMKNPLQVHIYPRLRY